MSKKAKKISKIHTDLKGRDHAVVVFSDMFGESSMKPLAEYWDYVFIQGGNYSWHMFTDWDYLNEIVSAYDHIVTTGMSMGGSGALLASHYIPVNRVVAFVPQINLKKSKWSRWWRPWMADLNRICNPVPGVNYQIHTGMLQSDIDQANLFNSGFNTIVWKDCADHQVAKFLRDQGKLYNTILNS